MLNCKSYHQILRCEVGANRRSVVVYGQKPEDAEAKPKEAEGV